MELKTKLIKIQSGLRVPKSQYNTFGKYSYRDCEDILEALKPLLCEYGTICTLSDEIVQVGDRYYVKATAIIIDSDTEDSIAVTAYARESETKAGMDAAQITGAASSYARKYALNGLFAIDDTKDADSENAQDKPKTAAKAENKPTQKKEAEKPKEISKAQEIAALIKGTKITGNDIAAKVKADFGKDKVNELTDSEFALFFEQIERCVSESENNRR